MTAITARDRYRETVAETLGDWRRYCAAVKPTSGPAREIIKLGIGEIATLRLQEAYTPVLGVLTTIEEKLFRLMKACSYERDDKWRDIKPAEIHSDEPPPLFIRRMHADLASTLEQRARAA